MRNYEQIGSEIDTSDLWKTLGRLVNSVSSMPYVGTEIRFVKIEGTDHSYHTHSLKEDKKPPNLRDFNCMGIGSSSEIGKNLDLEVQWYKGLPQQIRVIKPGINDKMWAIFFKD